MSNAIAPLAGLQSVDPAGTRGTAKSGTDFAAATSAVPSTTAAQAPPFANPSFRIDGPLGLVVMEFRDSSGKVESSIPTARQLEAYRLSGHVSTQATKVAAGHGGAATDSTAAAVPGTAAAVPGTGTPATHTTAVNGTPATVAPAVDVTAIATLASAAAPAGASIPPPLSTGTITVR